MTLTSLPNDPAFHQYTLKLASTLSEDYLRTMHPLSRVYIHLAGNVIVYRLENMWLVFETPEYGGSVSFVSQSENPAHIIATVKSLT